MGAAAFLERWHRIVRERDVAGLAPVYTMRPVNGVNALIGAIAPRMAEYLKRS